MIIIKQIFHKDYIPVPLTEFYYIKCKDKIVLETIDIQKRGELIIIYLKSPFKSIKQLNDFIYPEIRLDSRTGYPYTIRIPFSYKELNKKKENTVRKLQQNKISKTEYIQVIKLINGFIRTKRWWSKRRRRNKSCIQKKK